MTQKQIDGLKADVLGALMEKVEDIFIDFQNALQVKSGDISPLDAMELEKREKSLATMIADVLLFQKGEV